LFAFEMKYGTSNVKAPGAWIKNYPSASYSVITRSNYLQFITKKS
jgi:hypothetical protein